jgi:hypothetical protein
MAPKNLPNSSVLKDPVSKVQSYFQDLGLKPKHLQNLFLIIKIAILTRIVLLNLQTTITTQFIQECLRRWEEMLETNMNFL